MNEFWRSTPTFIICIIQYQNIRENNKEDSLKLIKQWLDTKKDDNEFYEKAITYALLYQAQLLFSKGDFDPAIDLLVETFQTNQKLCVCENYIVYIISILERLLKKTKKANEGILKSVEIIEKSLNSKQTKPTSILSYMADTLLDIEQYKTANRLYDLLMKSVIYSAIAYRV